MAPAIGALMMSWAMRSPGKAHAGLGFLDARLRAAQIAFAHQRGAPLLQRLDLDVDTLQAL